MGLSSYSSPSDGGILCMILVKTAMSITFMKTILRSILGIHMASLDEFSNQSVGVVESVELRTPSKTYIDAFRSRTPTLQFESLSCTTNQECECSVCLTEFKPDAEINRLSCGHVFHKSCLEKWLNYWNITCPLCRNHIFAPYEPEDITCPPDLTIFASDLRASTV